MKLLSKTINTMAASQDKTVIFCSNTMVKFARAIKYPRLVYLTSGSSFFYLVAVRNPSLDFLMVEGMWVEVWVNMEDVKPQNRNFFLFMEWFS